MDDNRKPLRPYVGMPEAPASAVSGGNDNPLGIPEHSQIAGVTQHSTGLALTATDIHNIQHVLPILIKNNPQVGLKPSAAPPHPQITSTTSAIAGGLQFSFNQLTSPTPYGNTITAYRIYRNKTSNNFSGSQLIRTITHDPTHQGAVTVQDLVGSNQTASYFCTAVDSTGQESSAPGSFQASAVAGGTVNNVQGAVGTTVAPSTSSTSYAVIPEMTKTVTFHGNPVLLTFSISFVYSAPGVTGQFASFALFKDGVQLTPDYSCAKADASGIVLFEDNFSITALDQPTAGSHTYDARWKVSSNTYPLQANTTARSLQIVELG